MSNGYLVAAEADIAAARELGDGFQLDVLELAALDGEAAVSLLANAANVGVLLSNAAAHDARFYAFAEALASRLRGAQLIVAEPDARAKFGFFPADWPTMALEEARRRAAELTRRREPVPLPAEPEEPVHAAPLPPVTHEEPAALAPELEVHAEAPPPVEQETPMAAQEEPAPIADEPAQEIEIASSGDSAVANEKLADEASAPASSPQLDAPEAEPSASQDVGAHAEFSPEPPAELHEEPPAPPAKFDPPPEDAIAAAPALPTDDTPTPPRDAITDAETAQVEGETPAPEAPPAPLPQPAPAAAAPQQTADNFGAQSTGGAVRSRGGLSAPAASLTADASAFAPKKLRRETPELVRVVLYQPHQLKEVLKAAKQIDPRAEAAPQGMRVGDVALGESVGVSLDVRGASCDGAIQRRVWNGEPIDFSFTVEADSDAKQAVILARVFVGDAQVGVIGFTRPISGAAKKAASAERLKLKRHKRVFLSYSSQDRETVSAIATAYEAAGVPYFWDRSSLKSGEEWSPRLRKEIDKADLFHLCWSKAAAKSEWVEKEAAHALTRRKRSNGKHPDITVQMLDGPPWAAHPIELDSINFDDFVRAAIVGYARGDGGDAA